jgi:hypothetical protein
LAKAGRIHARGGIETAHVIDDHRHRQLAQAGRDIRQHLAVGPQLGMQSFAGQGSSHVFQILQRRTTGEVAAGAALAEARRTHATRAQPAQALRGMGAQHGNAAQLRQGGERVQQQAVVFPIGAGLHEHAVGQVQAPQQRQIVGLQGFGWRIAAVLVQRIARVGAEQVGVAVPAPGDRIAHGLFPWCWGKGNAGCWPSGNGISWALSVIATMV